MPINVIIIAALSLIVLFVLITMFTGTAKKTVENLGSCVTKGGVCADDKKLEGFKGVCGGDYPIPLIVSGDCENAKPTKNLCCIGRPK